MSTQPACHNCIYAWWDRGQALAGFAIGFPSRPSCANHPERYGQMKPTPVGRVCRNYRPKPPTPEGDVKPIQLVEGLYAYVDAADYEWLCRYNWHLCSGGYAARYVGKKNVFMHRDIMKPPKGMIVDHKDGNRLNNCRYNLRLCTPRENQWNSAKHVNAESRFKGVCYSKAADKYYARFRHEGERIWLGMFDEELDAARVYDLAAVQHRGEHARLNLPEEWPPERRAQVRAEWLQAQEEKTEDRGRRPEHGRRKAVGKKAKGKAAERKTHDARRKTKPARATAKKGKAARPKTQNARRTTKRGKGPKRRTPKR